MNNRLRVEFHCHTTYSKDGLTTPAKLVETCRKKGIDRVVVTDHNEIEGALRAREIDPERVIIGEEIKTTAGEILAAYVTEKIPKGLPPLEVIARLRDQGAFISVSHPFDHVRTGAWELPALLEIAPLVDAVEVFNSRCAGQKPNQEALDFAREHGLLGTVGSDAHFPMELGAATLLLEDFHDPASLKTALAAAQLDTRMSPFWVHFVSTYAKIRKQMAEARAKKRAGRG